MDTTLMKKIIITTFLLFPFLAFALPVECRDTKIQCQERWDNKQECWSLNNSAINKIYGTDPAQCTAKAMLEYNIAARLKLGYPESIKLITKSADLPYDAKLDWSTSTPIGSAVPEVNSESGFIPAGLLVVIGTVLLAILGWVGIKWNAERSEIKR